MTDREDPFNPTLSMRISLQTWYVAAPLFDILQVQSKPYLQRTMQDGLKTIIWGLFYLYRKLRTRNLDKEEFTQLRDIFRTANPASIKITIWDDYAELSYRRYYADVDRGLPNTTD